MKQYNKISDNRGTFEELFKASDFFSAEQISLNIVEPGQKKGGHYHKITHEVFIVIEGEMEVHSNYICENFTTILTLNEKHPTNYVVIPPFTKHFIVSKNGCKFLVFANKEFDKNNPDTYTDNNT